MSDELKSRLNSTNTLFLGAIRDPQNVRISKLFKAADLFAIPDMLGSA